MFVCVGRFQGGGDEVHTAVILLDFVFSGGEWDGSWGRNRYVVMVPRVRMRKRFGV